MSHKRPECGLGKEVDRWREVTFRKWEQNPELGNCIRESGNRIYR